MHFNQKVALQVKTYEVIDTAMQLLDLLQWRKGIATFHR